MGRSAESDADLVVVGAGFSGTLLVCQLLRSTALRHAEQPLRLIWIERSGQFGQGLAYGTRDPNHLLNVSAGAMSAWADDPSHLLRWLELNREALQEQHLEGANASSFLPRQLYGQYLQTVLRDALAQAGGRCQLTKLQAELVDLERCPEPRDGIEPRYRLQLQGHGQLTARAVVLAWGNSAIPIGATSDPAIRHGWGDHPTSGLAPDAAVALIGTGLTMVDMVVSLQRQGHRGPIVALSRRGHRPKPHRKVRPYGPWLSIQEAPNTVLGLWRRIRSEIRHAQNQGEDWRAVVDGLRPITQELWQRLDHQQRHRFMRHAAVVWDVHRHRIAPELHDLLAGLEESGQLQILAGQVLEYSRQGDHLQLTLRRRGQQRLEQHIVDRVIICTGIPLSYGTSAEPLLSTLRQRGLLLPNDQGLGCRCDSTGALLDAQGQAQPGLYTLGSPRKGDLWESVAVPELRLQARDLAQQLLAAWPERLRALAPAHVDASVPASVQPAAPQAPLVRQLFDAESSTYTYLLADPLTGDAALVDPVLEQLERDLSLIHELRLRLRFCLETHLHADHITAAGALRRRTGCRVIVPAAEGVTNADQLLLGGETLPLGALEIHAIATPGHTPHHVAYRIGATHLFSGDSLLIRGCGRTDFQHGDAGQLFDSLQALLQLPEAMAVYPCHDYLGRGCSSIGEERRHNPKLLGRDREAFVALMAAQRLSPPKRMHDALPANQLLGDFDPSEAGSPVVDQSPLEQQRATATEDANRDILNDFIGMFI